MNNAASEIEKSVTKKIVDNWDNNGLAFFFALIGATTFCFAAIFNEDGLAVLLQLFGILVMYLMMLRIPVYYVAEKKGFSDKSSASLGLTVCFAILTALLTVNSNKRDAFYYFGLLITLIFSLLMVWRMNMKDSTINVRKTFTASTVVLLAQSVFAAILLAGPHEKSMKQIGLQAVFITILLIVCVGRLVSFLVNRDSLESKLKANPEGAAPEDAAGD